MASRGPGGVGAKHSPHYRIPTARQHSVDFGNHLHHAQHWNQRFGQLSMGAFSRTPLTAQFPVIYRKEAALSGCYEPVYQHLINCALRKDAPMPVY
jgi:hypothetical protein